MKARAKILGHPVHPMLIVFPLGLLPCSVVCDVVHQLLRSGPWAILAFYMMGAGIVGGLVAGIFGLIDWLSIPSGTRAKRVGSWHGMLNLAVILLFTCSWLLRHGNPTDVSFLATILAVVALIIALFSAWLGAELVYRLSIGVDPAAHENAGNSLKE
jgi:uncharacterized membrane protein